jgi:hypothetical protein
VIAILSLYCGSLDGCKDQPYSWVRRERVDREEERERSTAKCTNRTVCFHLIYQETHLCGCSPRQRVNHVNLVVLCS